MVLVAAVLAIGLTLAAIADLVFARPDPTRGKGWARLSVILLLVTYALAIAPFRIAIADRHPAATLLIAAASALFSLVAAIFARGRFRWFAAGAAVLVLVLIMPILAFVGSGQGVR